MEYHEVARHPKLRKVVKRSYDRLHNCIQSILENRNKQRLASGMLGFPYLEPKWLPNSVHI